MISLFLATTGTIEATDVYWLGGVIVLIIGLAQGLIYVGDRLWNNKKKKEEETATQSPACSFQHEGIRNIISIQLDQIKSTNEQLKEMVTSFRSLVEDSKLKHEIVVNYLRNAEKTNDEIKNKVDKLHERFDAVKTAIKFGPHGDD